MCTAKTDLKVKGRLNISNFNSILVEDRALFQSYIDKFQPRSCEYSFANLYCWQEPYSTRWCIYKDRLVIYQNLNSFSFFPLGKEMTPDELVEFSTDLKKNGLGTNISVVPSQYIERHPEIENFFSIKAERGSAEYIYSVEALCELKGAKLHKKKNLVSQFHRKYPNSSVEPLAGKFKEKAKALAVEIFNSHERFLHSIETEHMALMQAFHDFEKIGLEGLVLIVGTDIVAFSIFSPLPQDTYDIHFEKSCYHFKGAAQVINQETAKYLKGKCKYLNREQDIGIRGLRQAKMSYNPESLLRFHTLVFNQSC